MKLLIFILFFNFSVFARETSQIYTAQNYKDAKAQKNFLKFIGASTKLGLVSTNFDGYVKEFKIEGKISEDNAFIDQIKILMNSKSLDTDIDARNEKLYEKCLKTDKNPEMLARLEQRIKLTESEGSTSVFFRALEKEISVPIHYKISRDEQGWRINFQGQFSFKEAGIEDPSIFVAKVEEIFKIEGSFNIK